MQFTYWLLISAGLIDSDREGIILPARSLKPVPPPTLFFFFSFFFSFFTLMSCHWLLRGLLISDSGKIIMHFHYPLINRDFDYDAIIQWGHYVFPPPSLFGQYLIWSESYWDWPSCCFIDFFDSCFEPGTERGELGWHVQGRYSRAPHPEALALMQCFSEIIIYF